MRTSTGSSQGADGGDLGGVRVEEVAVVGPGGQVGGGVGVDSAEYGAASEGGAIPDLHIGKSVIYLIEPRITRSDDLPPRSERHD